MIQNKVNLIGRLTKDVEISATPNNKKMAKFSLAINMGKDASGNPKTQFIPVAAFENQANFLGQYTHKGDLIGVEGRLSLSQWQDSMTGNNRSRLDVIAENVMILGHPNNQNQQNNNQYQQTQNTTQNGYNQPSWNNNGFDNPYGITDDDLPF